MLVERNGDLPGGLCAANNSDMQGPMRQPTKTLSKPCTSHEENSAWVGTLEDNIESKSHRRG